MMGEIMQFPETVEEFMQQYKITDTQQVYTNGTELVPIFRMKQWFEAHKRRWIPCSERLPEDGELVLTYKNKRFEVQEYEKRRNGWISGGWFWSFGTVTHWQPLPEPPEKEEQNER